MGMGKPRASEVSDLQIVAAYQESQSVYQVERTLGVSATTIYRVLERLSVPRVGLEKYRRDAARFPLEIGAKLRAAYESGRSFTELIGEFGGTQYSVKAAIKRAGGVLIPVCPPASDEDDTRVRELHESGMSQMKISLALNRSQSFVSRSLRRQGVKPRLRAGEKHGMWRGGRITSTEGYTLVILEPDDPMASMRGKTGYVFEHRLEMARKLGRPLVASETVHHIDGNRGNNAHDNLQLRQGRHGKGVVLCCLDCGSKNIGPAEIAESDSTIVEAVGKAHGKLRF